MKWRQQKIHDLQKPVPFRCFSSRRSLSFAVQTYKPGKPKPMAKDSTSFFKASISLLFWSPSSKSFSFLPFSCCTCKEILIARSKNSATFSKSSVVQPRVVIEDAPIRIPPGESADASPCTQLRFNEIEQASQTFSTLEPVSP